MNGGARVIAIDLGGTKISAALVDQDGRVLRRVKRPSDSSFEAIAAAANEAVGTEWSSVSAAGLIVPGIYYTASGEAWAPNVWGWDNVPLRGRLCPLLPVPLAIDSDRAGYVLGEQWLGAARGLDDVIFLSVGTGIGAGIVSGGRLIRGASGISGAVGWFALNPEKKEIYRKIGCFEAEAAGPSVLRRDGRWKNTEEAVAAARTGDSRALASFEETARYLAMGIANLISVLNPRMVVLGGGLMAAGDLMLDIIRNEVSQWAQPVAARDTPIVLSELGEDAGLLGAAKLALTKE